MNYPYVYDYLGLAEEDKPSTMADGSTFYEVDTGKLYLAYKGIWYDQSFETEE